MSELIQKTVRFSGRVQGVGFRYSTCSVAARFDVTGYVKNLPDGRVEIVAEASLDELNRFIEAVKREMRSYISEVMVENGLATGRFRDFGIAY